MELTAPSLNVRPTTPSVIVVAATACAGIFAQPVLALAPPGSQSYRSQVSRSETIAESSRATESTQFLVTVSAADFDRELEVALHSVFQRMLIEERELESRAKAIFYESLPDMYRQ